MSSCTLLCLLGFFFFQAEDGIRDLVRSRGLGDVYKRQARLAAVLLVEPTQVEGALSELDASLVGRGLRLQLSLIHI